MNSNIEVLLIEIESTLGLKSKNISIEERLKKVFNNTNQCVLNEITFLNLFSSIVDYFNNKTLTITEINLINNALKYYANLLQRLISIQPIAIYPSGNKNPSSSLINFQLFEDIFLHKYINKIKIRNSNNKYIHFDTENIDKEYPNVDIYDHCFKNMANIHDWLRNDLIKHSKLNIKQKILNTIIFYCKFKNYFFQEMLSTSFFCDSKLNYMITVLIFQEVDYKDSHTILSILNYMNEFIILSKYLSNYSGGEKSILTMFKDFNDDNYNSLNNVEFSLLYEYEIAQLLNKHESIIDALSVLSWLRLSIKKPENEGISLTTHQILEILCSSYIKKCNQNSEMPSDENMGSLLIIIITLVLVDNDFNSFEPFDVVLNEELDVFGILLILSSRMELVSSPQKISLVQNYRNIIRSEILNKHTKFIKRLYCIRNKEFNNLALISIIDESIGGRNVCTSFPLTSKNINVLRSKIEKNVNTDLKQDSSKLFKNEKQIDDKLRLNISSENIPKHFVIDTDIEKLTKEFLLKYKINDELDSFNFLKKCSFDKFNYLIWQADKLKVDLIIIGFYSGGIHILHFDSCSSEFDAHPFFDGYFPSNLYLAFSEHNHAYQDQIHRISSLLAKKIADTYSLNRRICIIQPPSLSNLLVVPYLSNELNSNNINIQYNVAQLDFSIFYTDFFSIQDHYNDKFKGFPQQMGNDFTSIQNEVDWSKLGLKGSINKTFSRLDVIDELVNNNLVVHIASHGWYNESNPLFSGIITSNGVLFVFDLLNSPKKFNTKLFILNTCYSHKGGVYTSLYGLSPLNSCLINGVEVVMGNWFEVINDSAIKFVQDFKKTLQNTEKSFSEAYNYSIRNNNEDYNAYQYSIIGRSLFSLFYSWKESFSKHAEEYFN